MARAKNKLTAKQVKSFGDGTFQDGGGLQLVRRKGTGRWIYRYSFLGQRRDMGLGSQSSITLAEARKARDRWFAVLHSGVDPIEARELKRDDIRNARAAYDPTLEEAVIVALESIKETLKRDGESGRWLSPLKMHITPKMGKRRVSQIGQIEIRDALRPIWKTKHETARKAKRRLKIVLEKARAAGADCDPGAVDRAVEMLGAVAAKAKHIASTPWQDVPDLYARIGEATPKARALRFGILTLVRSDAFRGAKFSEIAGDVWTVPPERVKALVKYERDFRVPLSTEALRLVELCHSYAVDDHLFPGQRRGRVNDRALIRYLDELGEPGRVHGFRSSFKAWVQDTEACAWEVSEMVLDHKVGNSIERTYARSDLLDRRRPAMQAWSEYVTSEL